MTKLTPLIFLTDDSSGQHQQTVLAIAGGVLGVLLTIASCIAFTIFCKRHKAINVMKTDINDTYTDYYAEPDAVVEMTDQNDYYSADYYQAGSTMTRDNNSQYGC